MEKNYVITADGVVGEANELRHWGILGMKWGVRRYQNKDGSLTAAGKKRYAAENAALKKRESDIKAREKAVARQAKLDAKKAELDAREKALKNGHVAKKNKNDTAKTKKSVSEMTDEELRNETNRMRLESDYHNAQKSLAAANPKEIPAGQKFVTSLMDDVVVPAAKNAGKTWLENYMKDALGLNKPDKLTRLKRQHEILDWEKKIKDLKKDEDEISKLKKTHEKLDWEKKINDLTKDEDEITQLKKTHDKLDWEKKIDDLENPKEKEPSWEELNKKQTNIKNRYETEKARRDWEAYQADIETFGEDEAWERYTRKQKSGGN